MTNDYSSKSCCICDNGLFFELGRALAESFGKVYYTSPWVADFPVSYHTELGEGFAEVERVNDIWEVVDDVDLFVFPDLHQGPLQEYLAAQGKRVWGSRNGDEIEIYRPEAKELFKSLGIQQAPYEVIKGMSDLRKYIKGRGDDKLWIKISRTRGDAETFCAEGYELIKNRLDRIQAEFGPVAEFREFIVEDDLPDTFDLAIDTYCIDGQFPSIAQLGNEQKDEGYVCSVKPWQEMPKPLIDIYEKLAPTLKQFGYRNFFSLEIRVGESGFWLSDPCCRAGTPLLELELNMIENIPDILWSGAEGKIVDPVYKGSFGYEVLAQSEWADQNPLRIEFETKYRPQIKLRYAAQFPDGTWIMPQATNPWHSTETAFGAVVAYGNSLDECVEEVEKIAETIKGIGVEVFTGSIEAMTKNLKSLEDIGIQF